MTGKQWRISVIVAMMEYGEQQTGGHDVMHIVNLLFPKARSWYGEAEFELNQFRKHLAFLRELSRPPSLERQLLWALSSGVRRRHTIPKDFRSFLSTHQFRNSYLRNMANVRQQAAA